MSNYYLVNNFLRLTSNPLTRFECKRYLFKFSDKLRKKKSEGFYVL